MWRIQQLVGQYRQTRSVSRPCLHIQHRTPSGMLLKMSSAHQISCILSLQGCLLSPSYRPFPSLLHLKAVYTYHSQCLLYAVFVLISHHFGRKQWWVVEWLRRWANLGVITTTELLGGHGFKSHSQYEQVRVFHPGKKFQWFSLTENVWYLFSTQQDHLVANL